MAKQKFHRGDIVRVAKKLDVTRSHFTCDCDAIVFGSYADQYSGRGGTDVFTLLLLPQRRKPYTSSWYPEQSLTLKKRATLKSIRKVERHNREENQSGVFW